MSKSNKHLQEDQLSPDIDLLTLKDKDGMIPGPSTSFDNQNTNEAKLRKLQTSYRSLDNRVIYLEQQNEQLKLEISGLKNLLDTILIQCGEGSKLKIASQE